MKKQNRRIKMQSHKLKIELEKEPIIIIATGAMMTYALTTLDGFFDLYQKSKKFIIDEPETSLIMTEVDVKVGKGGWMGEVIVSRYGRGKAKARYPKGFYHLWTTKNKYEELPLIVRGNFRRTPAWVHFYFLNVGRVTINWGADGKITGIRP